MTALRQYAFTEKPYYPKGIDDEDYSVIVFTADSGRYYRSDGKADLTSDEISSFDSSCTLENGYSKKHR